MTRRVRFTPLLAAGLFCASLGEARASDVPFVVQTPVGTAALRGVVAADVDRDGDLDVVQNDANANLVSWLENTSGAGSGWTLRTIAAINFPQALAVADLDGDGDLDVAGSSMNDPSIRWFENVAGNGSAWTVRTIQPSSSILSMAAVDVDRDGDQDIALATGSQTFERVAWLENVNGNGSAWTERLVDTSPGVKQVVVGADLDGDGDPDLASGNAWHQNLGGGAWATHTLALGNSVDAVDLDRDGDLDLLVGNFGLRVVRWMENAAGNGSVWTVRTIGAELEDRVSWATADDIDGDGDADVLFGQGGTYATHRLRWFENTGGTGAVWPMRTLSTAVLVPQALGVADVDGDGDADLLASGFGAGFTWFRNVSLHGSACFVPRTLGGAPGAASIAASDVDGDGDLDAVSAYGNSIAWHENLTGSGSGWAARTVAPLTFAYSVVAGDVDRDGDTDLAALQNVGASSGAALAWFENANGAGTAWTPHTVSTAFGFSRDVALADLSGDGDLDLLGIGAYVPGVRWFENAAGNGTAWTSSLVTQGGLAAVAAADLDRDGDDDLVTSGWVLSPSFDWQENVAGNGSAWTRHTISTSFNSEARSLVPADVDGDGDLDIVNPRIAPPLDGSAWLENVGGSAATLVTHLLPGGGFGLRARAGDLDRDGDVDLLMVDQGLRWWRSLDGGGLNWSVLPVATASPNDFSPADLDGDGDLDVLTGGGAAGVPLAWQENQGGQVAVTVVDQAPATANNSDVVAMLRAVVTHLGRVGEGSLELASLGLLLEQDAGDPLTTAEANAIVESLRVYRDVNGNGVFDLATDALVTSVGTLALAGGVQVVPFTDGDPSVQVSSFTPGTYFVVVELTPNASTQSPHQLRVTLLQRGPSASVAEQVTSDIPLRLACPVDVASAIKQAVPVELIGFTIE